FNRLAWGLAPDRRPYGILAGGLESGELNLWDPKALISKGEASIMRNRLHKGPVRGLDFNPVDTKFLASGATDGEIYVWNLEDPSKPYSPGTRSQRLEDVSALAWNRQVFYILATGSNNGNSVIWDLRNRKEIICLTHPGGRRSISSLAWHPDNVLNGHSKGIVGLSWCSKDSDLLLSCGQDCRTIVWNPNTATMIGDLHYSRKPTFDAQWCQRNPDLVCVASYDGTVSVHSIQGHGETEVASAAPVDNSDPFNMSNFNQPDTSVQFTLPHPPKWLRRPAGCSWGFGGRLVSFGTGSGAEASVRSVTVRPVASEPAFVSRAVDLEMVQSGGNAEELIAYCQKMTSPENKTASDKDKDVWKFISVLFDAGAREQILNYLGFDKEDIGGPRLSGLLKRLKLAAEPPAEENGDAPANGAEADDGDVFAAVAANASLPPPKTPFKLFSGAKGEEHDVDALVTKALVMGDFETAVKVSLGAERLSDALMFAVCGGVELLGFAQREYFRRLRDKKSYARVLESVIKGDLHDVVENAQIDGTDGDWKDILAVVCTYSKNEDMNELLSILGRRLEALSAAPASAASSKGAAATADWKAREERKFAAVLCYLGAGDLGKVLDIWVVREAEEERLLRGLGESRLGKGATRQTARVLALQSVIEKVQLFRQAISYKDDDLVAAGDQAAADGGAGLKLDALYRRYVAYAQAAASQGMVGVAWDALQLVPASFQNPDAAVLRDRLFRSGLVPAATASAPAPEPPYAVTDLTAPAAAPAPVQQQRQQSYSRGQYAGGQYAVQPTYTGAPYGGVGYGGDYGGATDYYGNLQQPPQQYTADPRYQRYGGGVGDGAYQPPAPPTAAFGAPAGYAGTPPPPMAAGTSRSGSRPGVA
ncbi:protein transport protein S31, partial [Cladochytrium tenue]